MPSSVAMTYPAQMDKCRPFSAACDQLSTLEMVNNPLCNKMDIFNFQTCFSNDVVFL